ncbi:MAG: putative bifunctional diguanylate cyclase/phosphodiesterase [Vicinamibacterales bacterium]
MTRPAAAPVEPARLPWHARLEARVALALGLLVAVALGAVLVVTAGVVAAQSRDRVAADLDVAKTAVYTLLDQRLDAAIDEATLVTQLPVFRAQLAGGLRDRAALDAMSERHRRQMAADFTIVAAADGSWLGTAGWTDASGGGRNVVRDAQHAARGGRAAGALVQDGPRLFLAVAVPARDADAVVGTLTAGYLLTDEMTGELARLARSELALVVNGEVVATSLAAGVGRDDARLRLATMAAPGLKADVLEMGGRQYIAGVYPLLPDVPGGNAGRLLVLSDWALTQQFIDTLRVRFALAAVAALVLSLVGGVFLSRHLSRPLRDIATAAEEIAAGNLALQLPVRGTAEAASVARAFNAMSVSLRSAHERLVHDAIHDHLTQLPNRALFRERLDRALTRRARFPKYQFAVLFVDLDRFKHVNDSLGHTAGDRLLVVFGERLAAAVRSDDVVSRMSEASTSPEPTLARLGGDEFAVLLDGIREPLDAVRVAKRVQQMAMLPLPIDGQEVFATASIGVAVASDAHTSGEDIIRDADLAMYRAKNAGGGGYSVFDAALHDAAVRRLRLETDLRRAVEREEFRVWYQPIVSLTTRQVTGVEALVRWQHPERGLLGPGEFLEIAEEVGLIAQIDEWVLKEACLQAREWLRVGTFTPQTTVSVNLSARAFAQETLVKHVEDILRDTGCPATSLRLEITESAAIKDAARARAVLASLRTLGVRISLDDFGTGYSSLSYLQSLPLDTLKIDRSFVAGIGTDEDKGEIVKLIVGLALTLRLEIVAEGIETAAHVEYLRALGCQCGQGYFFAKPAEAGGRPPAAGARPAARLAV